MKHIFRYSIWMCMIFLLLQCRKDVITNFSGSSRLDNANNVSFLIQVIDQKGNPLTKVDVRLKNIGQVFTTNDMGIVSINKVLIPPIGLRASFLLDGYYEQIKMLTGVSNTHNTMIVEMVAVKPLSWISTGSEGNLDGRGKLSLPTTLYTENGSPYQGEVGISHHYFDPDSDHILRSAPGNMIALDSTNRYQVLATLGMYQIELFAPDGEKLYLKNGVKAKISFPIADRHQGNIPNKIPLWSFNEETGVWIAEGQASLEDNFMVAEVSHFSYWNVDLPYDFEEACFTLKSSNGQAVTGASLHFYVDDIYVFGYEMTNNAGQVCNRVPLNKGIKVEMWMYNRLIQVFDVGPYTSGGVEEVLQLSSSLTKVTGLALDCELNNIIDGYGIVYFESSVLNRIIIPIVEGKFEFYTLNENLELVFVNLSNAKVKELSINASELTETDLDLGNVQICESTILATISGRVMKDVDEDGIGDLPLAGIEVMAVYDSLSFPPKLFTTFTDQDGNYSLSVIPENYGIHIKGFNGKISECGDLSIDDVNEGDDGKFVPETFIPCFVNQNEVDADNNFLIVDVGTGSFSGKVTIDINEDGIGDKPIFNFPVNYIYGRNIYTALTNKDGEYVSNAMLPNSIGDLIIYPDTDLSAYADFDATPDPDGDDRILGSNASIPIRIQSGELDADNNFVLSLNKSFIVCQVLIDTNNDGVGDIAAGNQRVELYKRNQAGVPLSPLIFGKNTDVNGNISFNPIDQGEYVLYFIGNGTYTVQSGTDLIPDNNPVNTAGKQFISVDIVGKEYDDGNTFIVK